MGAKAALPEIRRRLDLDIVDRAGWSRLLADARSRASGYSVVRWIDTAPDETVGDVARLEGRLLLDAPMGDLIVEAENVDVDRIRSTEEMLRRRGRRSYHVGARHDASGRLAAWTMIAFDADTKSHAWQHITTVDPAYRGHRLGLVVKIENLLFTIAHEPDLQRINTWNATENSHMIAINEALGFRAIDGWVSWQHEIWPRHECMAQARPPRAARHDGPMTQATTLGSAHRFFEAHRETLDRARQAIAERSYWSAYPESPSPKVYGDTAAAEGEAAFRGLLGADFPLEQPGTKGWVATESSPFGVDLGVRYPHPDVDELLNAAQAGMAAWRDAGPETRLGVCAEILHRLHQNIFQLANAVQYTTGQAFVMAFQAGGPHALDRALEALAYAYVEMTRTPASADWSKPAGKGEPLRMTKTFHVVPRGVALVIGCNTFPTWNSYPGLFASLATGNAVVVKPHPRAVLPLAITVRVARDVLTDAGFDPNLVTLAAEEPGEGLASVLATRPEVRIIDFTGSTEYGDWLESHARQAAVYTEKAGVNTIIVDSTDDFAGMCRNVGFSLTLYSGQMCTTPQNILVPAAGIDTNEGHKTFDEVAAGIAGAVRGLTGDPARAVELTGAIVNDGVLQRVERARGEGDVILDSTAVTHPTHDGAIVRTPLIVKLPANAEATYGTEWFGPISFVISTESTEDSLKVFRRTVGAKGALTASVYSTDPGVLDAAEVAALDAGVHLSCNLTGGVFVNQSAAFSDFHATGANPAANASLTDGAYVANRFRIVQSRRHV